MSPLCEKKELCNSVKFVAALLVVNGHLFTFGYDDYNVARFMNLGAYCVSIFFFFSGYGLTYSFSSKGRAYLSGFFSKRLLRVVLPLVVAYAVTLPVYALLRGPVELKTVVSTLVWGGPYLKFSWYVTEIIVVYVLFYVTMILPCRYAIKLRILTCLVAMMMILLLVCHQPIWYVESLPGFVIGIWYQKYEGEILRKLNYSKLVSALLLFALVWLFSWQWDLCCGKVLTQYRYAFVAIFVSNIAFTLFVVSGLMLNKLPPPVYSRNSLIL
jgi:membrane-bound acyltransferase YfiQ involved in biofilm formation